MRHAEGALWQKNAKRKEKFGKIFGSVENNDYLCIRI